MPTEPRRSRDLAKEQFWRRIIRRQQQTDLTISTFCQREGLKLANFFWWRSELTRRDHQSRHCQRFISSSNTACVKSNCNGVTVIQPSARAVTSVSGCGSGQISSGFVQK